jgi:flagellar hook-associated protein 2
MNLPIKQISTGGSRMAGIQVGGIVSGLDTNSIVDKMIQQAKIPVNRLYGEYEYKKLEDKVYTEVDDMLGNIASDLLSLRLESTFKTKTTTSTNSSVVTATATTAASVGNHSIQVQQLAKNSIAASSYSRFSISSAGASVTGVSGLSADYLEGVSEVTVAQSGSDYVATTEMSVSNLGLFSKSKGANIDGGLVNSYGRLASDVTGDFTVSYKDNNGDSQTLTVSGTFGSTAASDEINDVAAKLEFALNESLNSAMGTSTQQYITIRAEYNSGTWNMAMYETTVTDHEISVAGTDAGTLRNELGFAESYTPSTSSVSKIYKYHAAASLSSLQAKTFDPVSGVVAGADFTVSGTLTEGTFTIAQDSTLNVSSGTYTKYTSAEASTGGGLDINVKGLDAAGFAKSVSSSTNGYFTINDTKITIDDYTKLTVNDLLGIINSSGAGVTATYDSSNDQFVLRSNSVGSTKISLGGYNDTSNMLSIMKFDYNSSPTLTTGSTVGSIDPSAHLTGTSMTVYPYSGTFTINGVAIYVDTSTESLNDVISKVNSSGAGVTMSYDAVSDKVTLKSDNLDAIEVGSASDTSNLLEAFNLTDDSTVTRTIGDIGQRAIITVDGTTYVRDKNTVDDIIPGVTLLLNGASDTAASIDVAVDTERAVETFAKFVAHYNELMNKLNVPEEEDEEDDYTTYLSETDKESMSEDDIAAYMEKYELYNSYDIIRRSSELRNMDTTMRRIFFSVRDGITGSINDMSDLGIKVAGAGDLETEKYGYLVEFSTDYEEIMAKLKDNTTFMTAISENPDEVFSFFANSPEKVESGQPGYNDYVSSLGWARYYNQMLVERYTGDEGMIGNKLGVSGTLYSQRAALERRIESQEDRVESQLERYWAQFTAMEQAIADAQAKASDFNNASSG